jgi:pimeloyl-ACP methyl ester carboxylesterase
MHNKNKPRRILLILIMIIAIPLAGFTGFYLYVQFNTYPAAEEKVAVINDHPDLEVTENRNLIIIKSTITNVQQPVIIFYPGGLVAPEAYLYKMGQVAAALETDLYIIKPPFNAAIFRVNAAAKVIADHQLTAVWVGGHSLGGIAAARFTADHMNLVNGLFLFASYSDQDLTGFKGEVVSLMGLNDQIINRDNYEAAKANLPPQAIIIEQTGLNHSDFGNYGQQQGDSPGILSETEIIAIILNAFHELQRADQ